jgi:hypothetical protein
LQLPEPACAVRLEFPPGGGDNVRLDRRGETDAIMKKSSRHARRVRRGLAAFRARLKQPVVRPPQVACNSPEILARLARIEENYARLETVFADTLERWPESLAAPEAAEVPPEPPSGRNAVLRRRRPR